MQAMDRIIKRNEEIDQINNTIRIQYDGGEWKHIKEEFDELKHKKEA